MNINLPIQNRLNTLKADKLPDAAMKHIIEEVKQDVERYAKKRCGKIAAKDVVKAMRKAMAAALKPETVS